MKGENYYHHDSKLKLLKMRSSGKAKYQDNGKIKKEAEFLSSKVSSSLVRVEPDRRWFGNTRVISHDCLDKFRTDLETKNQNPYAILLKRSKIPLGLSLNTLHKRSHENSLTKLEPYSHVFGSKSQRKRPRLDVSDLQTYASTIDIHDIQSQKKEAESENITSCDSIFFKGQSRRIWTELHKVLDSSDVILHVLDARDPEGTRCKLIEEYIQNDAPHKHLIFVLNKADLVPTDICSKWLKFYSKIRPTIVFHASIKNPFGRTSLTSLIHQFSKLHKEKRQISVGLVGFPNTGKSSIINALRKKEVCSVAPIPGQTKVWQYISFTKKINLIDCPGIVPPCTAGGSEADKVLRGVVRLENVSCPEDYIDTILKQIDIKTLEATYNLDLSRSEKSDELSFYLLNLFAKKYGKLLKGGEPDYRTAAILILNDWTRGKIPHYCTPPSI